MQIRFEVDDNAMEEPSNQNIVIFIQIATWQQFFWQNSQNVLDSGRSPTASTHILLIFNLKSASKILGSRKLCLVSVFCLNYEFLENIDPIKFCLQ